MDETQMKDKPSIIWMLSRLKLDAKQRREFDAEPDAYMDRHGLTEEEKAAVRKALATGEPLEIPPTGEDDPNIIWAQIIW